MSNNINEETNVGSSRRDFIAKAGKYAVVGAGMAALMTPGASAAKKYKIKGNNGFGNGDQDAPGNSCTNNNAENADCTD